MARIMVCDDSKTIRLLLDRKLKAAGHEITGIAQDGNDGIKLYTETRPELTLLDITMPNKDGRECLAAILSLDPSARVIMVSAVSDTTVVADCLKLGAKGFISKSKLYDDTEFKNEVLSVIETVLKAA
jgi:two-component system chemotaxis response regulator CheY